jgi:hypothetical protein
MRLKAEVLERLENIPAKDKGSLTPKMILFCGVTKPRYVKPWTEIWEYFDGRLYLVSKVDPVTKEKINFISKEDYLSIFEYNDLLEEDR